MAQFDSLRVLIVDKSLDDANRFISILRSADYKVDAKLASNDEEFQKYVSMRNWDLCIAPIAFRDLPAQTLFQRIRRAERDIPVVLVGETYDAQKLVEALRMGAEDLVLQDQDQHFLLVVARTLSAIRDRRQSREWERKLSLTEKRSQHLMDLSRHPIAIVQEGIYSYANEACASYFGYSSPDEMICLPILDNYSSNDRTKLKAYMVPLDPVNELMPFEAAVKTMDINGDAADAYLEISQIQYEGEPALQFTINKDKVLDTTIDSEALLTTEFSSIQPHLVYELISRGISNSVKTGEDCMMLNFQADRFDHLKQDLGVAKAEKVIHSLVNFIVESFSHNLECGRLTENSFVVIVPQTNQKKALELADGIAHQISQEVIDVDEESFSLTLSIGITVLNENVPSVERAIERSNEAIKQLRDGKEIGNGAKVYIPDINSEEVSREEAVVITAQRLLDDKLFTIRYQPIVPLLSEGEVHEYYEIILGISKDVPDREIPSDFNHNLFKSPIAGVVDRFVILEAMKSLTAKLKTHPDTQLFINVSSSSFTDQTFLPWLKTALKASKLPPNVLIFQLREADAVRHQKHALVIAEEMKKVKGKVGITHFGQAINATKSLESLPIDFVKVDRLVVEKLEAGGEGKREFEKLMGAMTGTGVQVIVPFIEKPNIIPVLWQQGVQFIQGHYVKPPSFEMDYEFEEG